MAVRTVFLVPVALATVVLAAIAAGLATRAGAHVLCVRGEASGLVACARYAVRATAG